MKRGAPLLRQQRFQPIRRLSPEDCDKLGYEGPLVLAAHELRFLFGLWRRTGELVATHARRGVVWQGSRAELRRLGVEPE